MFPIRSSVVAFGKLFFVIVGFPGYVDRYVFKIIRSHHESLCRKGKSQLKLQDRFNFIINPFYTE